MKSPCETCERQGCGSYHDQCPEYQEMRKRLDSINQQKYFEKELGGISRDHELKYRKNLKKGKKKP